MMKKIFIPIAALALFTLVACGNGESSVASSSVGPTYSKVEMLSITISNKEALKAEWHVGEADRAIEIESNPKINVSAAIAAGDLVIKSSDEAVVKVIGRNIHAVGAGTATVTVTYGDKSDTVELSPAAMLGEPSYVVGKGLADVMAVEDLVTDGDNARSKLAYAVKVKVEVIGSKSDGSKTADKYGNMWVKAEDGSGDLVQVYGSSASISALSYDLALGAYKFPGAKDYLDNPLTAAIKVGDVLDVLAIRADYKGAPEISMVIRSINGAVLANAEQTTDEVLETPLNDQVKQQVFAVTGKITALGSAADGSKGADKYGNMYIKSEGAKGNALQVYGTTATASALAIKDGEVKYTSPKDYLENEGTKNLKVGDLVTIVGVRCDYQEKIEIQGIVSLAGEPDPEPPVETGDILQYTAGVTANLEATGNAATLGLDAAKYTVDASGGERADLLPGINKDGTIRLYSLKSAEATGHGGKIIVTSLGADIASIKITFAKNANFANVYAGETLITGTDGAYTIGGKSFTVENGYKSDGSANEQVHFSKIVITLAA